MLSIMSYAGENLDLKKYTEASIEGLRGQTEIHQSTWGIGKSETWNVDQTTGLIWWTFPGGEKASAPVQIIGTYNPSDGRFMWGWDHPSVQPAIQAHAKLVRAFGEKHKISTFTDQVVKVSEAEVWGFVAIANRLAKANGGYRANTGGPIVFMTYGKITLEKGAP